MNPYILLYKTLLPRRYQEYLNRAGGDADKCHEALLHGTYYEEYDVYDFAHKSESERRSYVTDAWRNKVCRRINDASQQAVIMDKYLTATYFRDYYRRDFIRIQANDDMSDFVDFALRNGQVVVKPTTDCAGRGVQLITASSLQEWVSEFSRLIATRRPYIVEQLIHQHDDMARWNPTSVNTIRVNTLLRHGKVRILTANIRIGRPGTFVDNVAQGGLCANIDPATGLICTTACSQGELRYDQHPDSHLPFIGTPITQWDALISTAEAMAHMLPKLTYCSWDYALTSQGWTLVEANKGELIADQRNLGYGLRRQFME